MACKLRGQWPLLRTFLFLYVVHVGLFLDENTLSRNILLSASKTTMTGLEGISAS